VYAALDELRATLYDHLNLSPPPRDRRSEFRPTTGVTVRQDEIQVLPPAEEAEPAGLEPMQALGSRQSTGGHPVADHSTAQAALTQKNYQEALSLFDAYLERYPGTELCARAQYWKAFCYRRLGKAEEAVAEYEKVRREYPNSERVPSSLRNEAVVLIELGQTDKAEALLEKLIEEYPMSPAAEGAKAALESLRGN